MSTLAERLAFAVRLKGLRERREIEQKELAAEVTRLEGRAKPYTQASASGWMAGSATRLPVILALATYLGVDPGWLAFGEECKCPPPEGWELTRLSEDEVRKRVGDVKAGLRPPTDDAQSGSGRRAG